MVMMSKQDLLYKEDNDKANDGHDECKRVIGIDGLSE